MLDTHIHTSGPGGGNTRAYHVRVIRGARPMITRVLITSTPTRNIPGALPMHTNHWTYHTCLSSWWGWAWRPRWGLPCKTRWVCGKCRSGWVMHNHLLHHHTIHPHTEPRQARGGHAWTSRRYRPRSPGSSCTCPSGRGGAATLTSLVSRAGKTCF